MGPRISTSVEHSRLAAWSLCHFNRLFERGADAVGMDFMPHVFWDKFIAFYEEDQDFPKLAKLMERIIKIPQHQYARFYQQ